MNPSKSGLSSAGKAGMVVVLIVIVLGAAYVVPSLSKGGGSQSANSNSAPTPVTGMLSLVGDFPKMEVSLSTYDAPSGLIENQSFAYAVIGTGAYTKVEFTTVGVGHEIVAWYNSTGVITEEDVIGQRNYTGSGVYTLPFMVPYNSAFGALVSITGNSTLLSFMSKTSEATTGIGPTQMDVSTYVLAVPTPPYSRLTVKMATIPGTDVQFAVYVNQKTTDGSTSLLQVTSLSR